MTVLLVLLLYSLVRGVIAMTDISNARTVPFDVAPGFAGAIFIGGMNGIGGTAVNLTKWSPRIRGEPVDATNFNSPNDPITGVKYKEWVPGSNDGEFTLEGVRDFSITGWNPMPGVACEAFFAYDTALGFAVKILVIDIGGDQDANRAGMFTATVKTNGLIDFLGRADIQDLIVGGTTSSLSTP
jgi:hypothetical protein